MQMTCKHECNWTRGSVSLPRAQCASEGRRGNMDRSWGSHRASQGWQGPGRDNATLDPVCGSLCTVKLLSPRPSGHTSPASHTHTHAHMHTHTGTYTHAYTRTAGVQSRKYWHTQPLTGTDHTIQANTHAQTHTTFRNKPWLKTARIQTHAQTQQRHTQPH